MEKFKNFDISQGELDLIDDIVYEKVEEIVNVVNVDINNVYNGFGGDLQFRIELRDTILEFIDEQLN